MSMSTSPDALDPEGAVRLYLLYLEDPSQLRDDAVIQKKTQEVLDAEDPIEKIRAVAELKRAALVDEEPLRRAFVAHARAWADNEQIPVAAFQELHVPDDVLREAGFRVPASSARRRSGPAPSGEATRQRAKAVPADEIKAKVREWTDTFVLTDVQNGIGGSPATVRKAVDELVESGEVEKLGPQADYEGRGRAPIQYRRV